MDCIKDKCSFFKEDIFRSSIGRCKVNSLDTPISKLSQKECVIEREINRLRNKMRYLKEFSLIIKDSEKYECVRIECDENCDYVCNSIYTHNKHRVNSEECEFYLCEYEDDEDED